MNERMIRVLFWCTVGGALGWWAGKTLASTITLPEEGDDGAWEKMADEDAEKWADGNGPQLIILDKGTTKEIQENTRRVDYTKYQKSSLEELVEKYADEEAQEEPEIKDDNYPHIITINQFGEDGQECEALKYYEEDDSLADEQDTLISDAEGILGGEALLNFGKGSEDVDIVYVRNKKLGLDYEVTRVHGSFSEEVLGVKPEPPKAPAKNTTKRRTTRARTKSSDDDDESEE